MNKLKTIGICLLVILFIILFVNLQNFITNSIKEHNLYISDIMRVTTEEELNYAIEHKLSDFLVSGIVTANQEQTLPELKGSYSRITKSKQCLRIYTEKYWDDDGDLRTRTKKKWETIDRKDYSTNTYTLLGKQISALNLSYKNTTYINYKDIGKDIGEKDDHYNYEGNETKYEYYVIPKSWKVSLIMDSELNIKENYGSQSIEQIISPVGTTWVIALFIILYIIYVFLF